MSAEYNVISRINPRDAAAPPKYYPSYKSSGRVTLRQLSKKIAQISTVSTADTMAVLESLLELIPQELADGNIVELGAFDSFRLTINAEGSATPEEVSSRNIKKINSRFMPGKEFKQVVDITEFKKESGVA